MSYSWRKIRTFLTENKILFETVAATTLSLMAVTVSVAQFLTASRQTEFIKLQTQIAEAQALPQFEVAVHPSQNTETGLYDNNYLTVINHGGFVQDFRAMTAFFLDVSLGIPNTAYGTYTMPVDGYFTAESVGTGGTGELATMFANGNNAHFIELSRGAREIANTRKWDYANVEIRIIVRLDYRDLLGRSHEDYYAVRSVGPGTRMPVASSKATFEGWEHARRVDFTSLSAGDLVESTVKGLGKGAAILPATP